MDKHITLVGILNIVYRSLMLLGALILFAIAMGFGGLIEFLSRTEEANFRDVPVAVLHIVPLILVIIGFVLATVSVLGIIGGIGVLKQKEWARVLLLVVSFFNLLHVPLGTALGVYSIWVLINSETIKMFSTAGQNAPATTT